MPTVHLQAAPRGKGLQLCHAFDCLLATVAFSKPLLISLSSDKKRVTSGAHRKSLQPGVCLQARGLTWLFTAHLLPESLLCFEAAYLPGGSLPQAIYRARACEAKTV